MARRAAWSASLGQDQDVAEHGDPAVGAVCGAVRHLLASAGCKGNDWERWYEERQSNGHWKLKNKATGWYLDSNSNHQVYGEPANAGDYQEWK